MVHYCCIVNCKNTNLNSNYKFYRFPTAGYKKPQKMKWINAIKRVNNDGSTWTPGMYDRICSQHFIGGAKSDTETSPSYVPTLFPSVYKAKVVNEKAAMERHTRFMQRRRINENIIKALDNVEGHRVKVFDNYQITEYQLEDLNQFPKETNFCKSNVDKACQVDESQFIMQSSLKCTGAETTGICNRLVTVIIDRAQDGEINNSIVINNVEIQTTITLAKTVTIPSQKKMQNKETNTPVKVYDDSSVGVDLSKCQDLSKRKGFYGYESLKNEERLVGLAGVQHDTFEFLLDLTPVPAHNCKVSRQDRLLLLLMKLKTGLCFSSLSYLFDVHRTTVSKIVIYTLQYLASTSANIIFWPTKAQVQGTMPKCFHPNYSNTRVIIDCTEFRTQGPYEADDKIHSYSQYKHAYTAKILIAITPSGFICLKSNVAGGRKCDSQITIESGLLDLLEEGDVVLADKGFPEIRKQMNEKGQNILVVLPPYLENKSEFTREETEETYKIASVRIHVERVIQRLRIYNILNNGIPTSLFHYIDDVLHVICVLVNLQSPIHADDNKSKD